MGDPGIAGPARGAAIAGALSAVLPSVAHAQHVPGLVVVAALSPLLMILLCALLGWLRRSLRVAAGHAALIMLWTLLFWLASRYVTSDLVIWTPLALYLIHSVVIIVSIIARVARRVGIGKAQRSGDGIRTTTRLS